MLERSTTFMNAIPGNDLVPDADLRLLAVAVIDGAEDDLAVARRADAEALEIDLVALRWRIWPSWPSSEMRHSGGLALVEHRQLALHLVGS